MKRSNPPPAGDYFPSFSEGLSLRGEGWGLVVQDGDLFPFLFGGTFIEGPLRALETCFERVEFPFLFGGTFIEGLVVG